LRIGWVHQRLSQYSFLLKELVRRDFQGRYAGSWLGFLWSFVQPLWLLGLYGLVFSTVLQVSPVGERTGSFAIFLFAGLLPWMAFHEGATRAATAITDNAPLVKKLSFPSELLVLAVVLTALLHEAIAGAVFVVVLVVVGEISFTSLPWLLVAIPLQVALTLGMGLFLAALNVFVRDTSQLVGMVFSSWFFLTPIVYPLSLLEKGDWEWLGWVRWGIEANPLTVLVTLYRLAFLGGDGAPPGVLSLAGLAAAFLVLGVWVFRRLRSAFVDEI
jgi:lipopolysaccharide transport system permease protein